MVEVDWRGTGAWQDITDRVALGAAPLTITVGRDSVDADAQPGTLALTLDNTDGAVTPDNATSPWWPLVGEDVPIRVTVSHSGAAWRRFTGRVDAWTPTFGDGAPVVAITATDRLGGLTRPMPSALQQYLEAQPATMGWSLIELPTDATATTIANAATGRAPAVVVADAVTPGQVSAGDAGTLGVASAWTFASNTSDRRGSGVVLPVDLDTIGAGGVWLQSSQEVTAAEGFDVVAQALATYGVVWRVTLAYSSSGTVLELRDRDGAVVATVARIADGQWHSIMWRAGTVSLVGLCTRMYVDGVLVTTLLRSDPSDIVQAVYGADVDSRTHTVTRQFRGALAGLWWLGADEPSPRAHTDPGTEAVARGSGLSTAGWPTVLRELAASTAGTIRSATALGDDTRSVRRVNGAGRTTLEHLLTLARSVGGVLWHDPNADAVVLAGPGGTSPASALTVTVGADDADGISWSRGIDARPTRVTASAPITGTAVAVDTVTEGKGIRREASVDTLCPTPEDLYGVATSRLNRARALRATALPIDLLTAAHDLWAAVMGLTPGSRLTLDGLPAAWFGASARDLVVAGWTETYGHGVALVTLVTDAADDPTEGLYEAARWCSDGSLRLVGAVDATATSLTLTADTGEALLTTDAADYPIDLDVAGERVTVTSAPTGTTTQTVTVVRGVAPTPARTHPVGELVDVWAAPTWAL